MKKSPDASRGHFLTIQVDLPLYKHYHKFFRQQIFDLLYSEWFVFGWFLVILGSGTNFIGYFQLWKPELPRPGLSDNIYKAVLFPILVALSPVIFIIMKFLPTVRNSKLIQNMVKVASDGEVLFESAPQLTLQLYIVLSHLNPDGWAWFSITTSSLSLLFSLVYSQYIENLREHSWRDYVKSVIVILPNMLFRILSLRYLLIESITIILNLLFVFFSAFCLST